MVLSMPIGIMARMERLSWILQRLREHRLLLSLPFLENGLVKDDLGREEM